MWKGEVVDVLKHEVHVSIFLYENASSQKQSLAIVNIIFELECLIQTVHREQDWKKPCKSGSELAEKGKIHWFVVLSYSRSNDLVWVLSDACTVGGKTVGEMCQNVPVNL